MTEGLSEETPKGNGHALITGTGAVTPIGTGTENFWDAALHGKSGIGEITLFDPSPFPSHIAGECSDFDPTDFMSKKEARRMDRYAQFGIAAGIQAAESAGIVDTVGERPERVAIVIGSGIGGLSTWEREYKVLNERGPNRVSPFLITMMVPNMAAGQLAIMLGAKGPTQCPVLACATGGEAIAEGLELIRRGDADVVIAGSAEAPITPLSMAGFCAIRAISTRNDEPHKASRPFDAGRDGFAMSEGAGAVVLESVEHAERRGAEPIATVAGYARTTDAYHVTAPDEQGRGVERAMKLALEDSGLVGGGHRARQRPRHLHPNRGRPRNQSGFEGDAARSSIGDQVYDRAFFRGGRRHGRHHVCPRHKKQSLAADDQPGRARGGLRAARLRTK